jgi:cobyrinic acid a,c-diamide synthase
MNSVRCIVIGGTHSGAGKTSVATALMRAYVRRGLRVQAFKVGPDFIDPSFHRAATGRASHNLDGWMLSRERNLELYVRATHDADFCIVEGVMGLFDGHSAITEQGSTAEMAKWLGGPVILVADGSAMARSGAALVHGFESFDPELRVVGALFNRVSSERHFAYLRDSMRAHCRAVPLGYLHNDPAIRLPERHLGLHLANEVLTADLLDALGNWAEQSIDLDALLALARSATPHPALSTAEALMGGGSTRIAVARDLAFQFYYDENFAELRRCGAELVEYSPIRDTQLPDDIGGLYLGGGYPELHARALAANESMRESVRTFARRGGVIYAECGGFMYLTESIVDQDGQQHQMCGIFPTRARMQQRLAALGYAELEVIGRDSWLPQGQVMRGHEFRYSTIDEMPDTTPRLYRVHRVRGDSVDGFSTGNVVGSYFHVHFGSSPDFATALVRAARASLPNTPIEGKSS